MPSELWDIREWPSPSPEAEVRARVLGRARTLTMRRLAPLVAALLLASAAALHGWPGSESSARVHVVDQGEHVVNDVDSPSPPAAPAGPQAPAGGHQGSVSRPVAGARPTPSLPKQPANPATNGVADTAATDHPLIHDPTGDAHYGAGVAGDTSSQPAFDLEMGDVVLAAGSVRMAASVVALSAPMGSDGALGGPPDREVFLAMLGYEGGVFRFWAVHRPSTGEWTTTGEWCPDHAADETQAASCTVVEHVSQTVDVSHSLVVISADLIAMNQALMQANGTRAQVAPGTVLTPVFETLALRAVPGSDIDQAPDRVDTAKRDPAAPPYRLGS